jgi:DNA (cytosine-5)-methyltransferase 1
MWSREGASLSNSMLKVLDLFSGIGGFSLGLERTGGFETVAFCEIEPFPRKVLAKHWPKVPCYDDVRTLTVERLAADGIDVDVITGGFPCQDISTTGKQAGISETTRSGLWSEITRLAGDLRPEYIIVENVTNLLAGPSERPGGWFGRVLGDLAALRYDAEWHCIPASHVGANHGRDRVWVLAYPERIGRNCLVEGKQIKAAAFDLKGFDPRCPNPMELLPDLGELFTGPSSEIERNDDGLPEGLGRLKGAGNAVVPQIPELIGNAILASRQELAA